MKSTERLVRIPISILVLIVLFAAGCTNDPEPVTAPDADPATQTTTDVSAETPVPAETPATDSNTPTEAAPTPEPAPLTNADRIDAAIDGLNRDGTGDLIAWDILDSTVRDDGNVTLTLCGWTGDTVFDQVYTSIWNIEDTNGTPALASEINTSPTAGDCLNTELIDTALATVEEFEAYWVQINQDPAAFRVDSRSSELLTALYLQDIASATEDWERDGLTFLGLSIAKPLNEAVTPNLFRRLSSSSGGILELAVCRDMDDTYGTYKDGVLLDSGRTSEASGRHSVDAYLLARTETGWQVDFADALVWSDCLEFDDWAAAASTWREASIPYEVLPS